MSDKQPRRSISREDAIIGLCGLPRMRRDDAEHDRLPGYIAFRCPRCGAWHQALDTPILRTMLKHFSTVEIIDTPAPGSPA